MEDLRQQAMVLSRASEIDYRRCFMPTNVNSRVRPVFPLLMQFILTKEDLLKSIISNAESVGMKDIVENLKSDQDLSESIQHLYQKLDNECGGFSNDEESFLTLIEQLKLSSYFRIFTKHKDYIDYYIAYVTANPDSHTFKTLIQSYERHFNTPKYLTFFNAAFQQNESLKEIKKYIKISTNSPKQTILYKAKSIIGFQSNDNGDGFILFQNLGSDYFKFSASDVSPISEDVVLESLKENWIFAFYSKENDLNSPYETIIYKPISSHCDESLKSTYKVRLKSFSCVLKVPKTFQKFLMRKTNLCFYALNSML